MGGKHPRSFTIDEDLHEQLRQRSDINASGVVNEFLREYLDTSADNQAEAMVRQLKREIREIDSDIEDLEAKRSEKVDQLQEWKDRRDKIESNREDDALELVRGAPAKPNNGRVQVAADRLGITAEEMVERMKEEGIHGSYQ